MSKFWPTKKLGDFLKRVEKPVRIEPNKNYKRVTVKLYGQGIKLRNEVKGEKIGTERQFLIRTGQLLLSRIDARNGAFGIVPNELDNAIVTGSFWVFDIDQKQILPGYFQYFVRRKEFFRDLEKLSFGTTNRRNLDENAFLNYKISLPPLSIQQKIVERLDAIKKAQELNDKQIKLAEELYRSLLHNELNAKFKTQNSKLQFKIKKLREVITINYGKGLAKSERQENGRYFAYGSNGPVYKTNKILVNNPTIIIGRKGAVGALYLTKEPSWPIDTTFYVEIKDKDELDLDFLYFLLQTMNLHYLAIVTAVPGINRDNLYNLKIPLPPLEIQQKIVEKLSAVQEYKKKLLDQKQKLQELFESVLNKSFKGELIK